MFETVKKVARFDLEIAADLEAYEELLNNPLCTVINNEEDRRQEVEIDGEFQRRREDVHKIITYLEKELI